MRLGAQAMNAALMNLKQLSYHTQVASAFEAFLTAKWIEANESGKPSFTNVGRAVPSIFGVLPDHDLGRLAPFKFDWRTLADTGRKTVWNNNTRVGSRMSQTLFVSNDIRNGLKSDAAILLSGMLPPPEEERPAWQSLAAILLRDEDFASDANWDIANQMLRDRLALTNDDLAILTSYVDLGVPLLSEPEWTFDTLNEAVRPQEAVVIQTPATSSATSATTPVQATLSVVVDSRVERMLRLALMAYSSILLVGPPGTGKGTLLRWALADIAARPIHYGFDEGFAPDPLWRTPDESWTAFDLIGGLAPDTNGVLTWSPGALLNAIDEDRWLILDETNRADMDKIMGPLLTWLSKQEVEVGRSAAHDGLPIRIGWGSERASEVTDSADRGQRYLAGGDWRLLGTYNPQDAQRVFRFGQALSRRFVIIPVPPVMPGQFAQLLETAYPDLAAPAAEAIGSLYSAHLADDSAALGPAIFLGIARYVLAGLGASTPVEILPEIVAEPTESPVTDEEPADLLPDSLLSELLAEAYVLGAGRYLAGYDDRTFDALGERIVNDEAALAIGQWSWIKTQRDILS